MVLCLVSAVAYSISLILQKPLVRRLSAVQVTWLACTVGAISCLPFAGDLVSQVLGTKVPVARPLPAARLAAPESGFTLTLALSPTQPVLLQGRQGLSRKGPEAAQASYYYSEPQLAVRGRLSLQGRDFDVTGRAWMDHEWSEALMHPEAVGWDWIGMNLDDGSALTAFRLRRKDGSTLWDGGSFRSAGGALYIASPGETEFRPQKRWTSPATGRCTWSTPPSGAAATWATYAATAAPCRPSA